MHRRPLPSTRVALFLAVLLLGGCALSSGCSSALHREGSERSIAPTVVLVSLDGVRWDFLEMYDTPNLSSLAAEGVRAERLTPVFPTKTFPNHYSTVTGLYAENHGIISNTMYDPVMDAGFSLSNREAIIDQRWWEGEPLWVTAEKQGQIAATYFWPGSEAPIQGVRPAYWLEYDGRIPGEERVDQVLEWLDLPVEERPTFITLYFSDVDGAGHRHGPEAEEVSEALSDVDALVGRLMDGLESRGIDDDVNVIITSDHGMAETSQHRAIILDDYFDPESARIVDYSPILMMYPPDGVNEDSLVRALDSHDHLVAFTKSQIPERFHIADHPRTPPILAVADEGWSITTRDRYQESPERLNGGTHGYDNELVSMGGIFIARGPAFRSGYVAEPIINIHVYELVCEILGLDPAPNDGRLDAVDELLRTERP